MIKTFLTPILRVLAKAFRTIVTKLPDNKEDCPPVMHSRHSKDAHEMLARHLAKAGLSPDDEQDIIAAERARCLIELELDDERKEYNK